MSGYSTPALDFTREPFSFRFETRLRADAATVWAHATSMEGVNRELAPLARMSVPPGPTRLDERPVVAGQRLMRSWIYAFGVLPVDYDDVTLVEIGEGRFLERSPMLTQRLWEHERSVEPLPEGGCILRDRVRFEPRVAALGYLQLPIFRLVFANRHRQLARIFRRA